MSTRGIIIPVDVSASIAGMIGKTGNNTAGEDSPSNPSPARIVDIRNVMPTEDGYFSAFAPIALNVDRSTHVDPHPFKYTEFTEDQDTRPLAALKMARTQQVIPYETAAGVRVYVILAETGIFVRNHMVRIGENVAEPEKVVGPADVVEVISPEEGVFNLWTTAVIDGNLYCYLQGKEEVYVIGDLGTHLSMETLGTEHRIVRKWESDILQVVAAKPSFLNMSGQVGIFRAGNRLGFWDSDNSIAWSSAFDKMDFTPDVTSLAGATKFAALTGTIISILPTTRGFLVYATSSVLNAVPSGSEELWAADLVLAEAGIEYYFQATTGSNPDQHFAWTKTGLYRIQGGKAEKILEDDYRALRATLGNGTEALYRLTAIDDTYLVISRASYWEERPAKSDFVIGNIKGEKGDYPFYIPSVKVPTPELGIGWQDVLEGRYPGLENPNLDDDWILEDPDMPPLDEGKPLIPFWTGFRYVTPNNFSLRSTPWSSTDFPIPEFPSTILDGVVIKRADGFYESEGSDLYEVCTDKLPNPMASTIRHRTLPHTFEWNSRITGWMAGGGKFIDKAGQEFYDEMQESLLRYKADIEILWGEIGGAEGLGAVDPLEVYTNQCGILRESIDNFYLYGWQMTGIDESMSYPGEFEDIPYPDLVPKGTPTPTSWYNHAGQGTKEFYTEELHEYFKNFFHPGIPTPHASMTKVYENAVAGKLPFPDVPLHVEVDSCSIRVMAFADTVNFTRILWQEPILFREGGRRPVLVNGQWEDSPTVPNTPVDISYRIASGGVPVYTYTMGFYRNFPYMLYPASFQNKDWETINEMLDPANRAKYPELWVTIFEAEVSGLGYSRRITDTWTTYRKTISRARLWLTNPEGSCEYNKPPKIITWEDNFEFEDVVLDHDEGGEYEYGDWPWGKYPEDITAEDGYPDIPEWEWPVDVAYGATYRRGTRMPYYPIYEKAWVLDMPLVKWGSMDWPHSCLFSTNPVNGMGSSIIANKLIGKDSVDYIMPFGIVPKFVTPRQAYWEDPYQWQLLYEDFYSNEFGEVPPELLIQHGLPVLLNRGGTGGRMTFRTTALTRDGHTKLVGISGNGITKATMEILGSFHGETFGSVMPMSAYNPLPMHFSKAQSRVISWDLDPLTSGGREFQDFRAPFVLIGKEFQITLAGHFSLQKLICYGQPTGSIRFYPSQNIPW